jgi:hypothetical protein
MIGPSPFHRTGLDAVAREPISATAAAGAGAAASGAAAAGAAAGAAASIGAVSTGTSAVAGGAVTASTLATLGSYATIASTLAGIGMQTLAARRSAAVQRGQAAGADFAATQELIRGQQQGNALRESLLRTLAGQRARFAASGLTPDDGTAMNLQDQTAAQAERELVVQDGNSLIRSEEFRTRASLLDDAADFTEAGGAFNAGVNLFDAYDRWSQRQPGTVRQPLPTKKPPPLGV